METPPNRASNGEPEIARNTLIECDQVSGRKNDLARLPCRFNGRRTVYALVDADVFQWAQLRAWHIDDSGYVRAGKTRLHRLILDPPEGMEVDHISHDLLDNRRANLRLCTRTQNQANRRPSGNREWKGVFKHSKSGYEAKIGLAGESIYLGLHRTPEAAAIAYDVMAKTLYGEFACLNFPEKDTPTLASVLKSAARESRASG